MSALYQKYRPIQFCDVMGQGDIVHVLQNQARRHEFHHAYLFHGPSGTGKTTTARILSMALNCLSMNGTGEPCGVCDACRLTARSAHWDCIEIDGGRFRGIDAIRDLCYKAYFSPMGKRKIYLIDECHQLTEEAWGGLLKLLEEPPPHLTIILCTTNVEKLPETVISRCEVFAFGKLPDNDMANKLSRIMTDMGLKPGRETLAFVTAKADGNMRSAENILQQLCVARG